MTVRQNCDNGKPAGEQLSKAAEISCRARLLVKDVNQKYSFDSIKSFAMNKDRPKPSKANSLGFKCNDTTTVLGRLPGTASMFGITALQRPHARGASALP